MIIRREFKCNEHWFGHVSSNGVSKYDRGNNEDTVKKTREIRVNGNRRGRDKPKNK